MMTQVEAAGDCSRAAVAPPPPPPQRRPRVREVSSRFMSPLPSPSCSSSSTSVGDLARSPLHKKQQQQQRSVSAQRQRRHLETEADENRPTETLRSLESPFANTNAEKKLLQSQSRIYSDTCKSFGRTPLRPDTPTLSGLDRTASAASRIRLNQRPVNVTASAAAKLFQSSGMSLPKSNAKPSAAAPCSSQQCSSNSVNSSSFSSFSEDSNKIVCSSCSLPDLRSSMPEADLLPSVSNRLLTERNINRGSASGDTSKLAASPFSRSLNSPLSSCETSLFHHPMKASSTKMGALSLPPVPPYAKPAIEAKKPKKVSSHQEDVHMLKLIHNHYLQWRYANAKAVTSMEAQKRETERTLYSLGAKISQLYDSVKRNRMELGILLRMKTLSTILQAQMPYLEEWYAFQGDYANSLSEAVEALLNTLRQLPISGNVRADVRELGEAINAAIKLMEMILFHVQSFMPKAEELESLTSELARVTGKERALVEEYGDLLSKTDACQVEECSLRGQLIQISAAGIVYE